MDKTQANQHPVFKKKPKAPVPPAAVRDGTPLAGARARLWNAEDGAGWRMLVPRSWLGKIRSVLAPIE